MFKVHLQGTSRRTELKGDKEVEIMTNEMSLQREEETSMQCTATEPQVISTRLLQSPAGNQYKCGWTDAFEIYLI